MNDDEDVDDLRKALEKTEEEIIKIKSATKDVCAILDFWLPEQISHATRVRVVESSRLIAKQTALPYTSAHPEPLLDWVAPQNASKVPLLEGWLWTKSESRRWVCVLRDRLRWSDGPNSASNGILPYDSVASVSLHERVVAIHLNPESFDGTAQHPICFTTDGPAEALRWFQAIKMQCARSKAASGDGFLTGHDRCLPGYQALVKLPVLDNDTSTRERRVTWHIRPGQAVEKDDPLCDVHPRSKPGPSQAAAAAPPQPATFFSPCRGVVVRLGSDRVDRISGDVYVCQGNPLVVIAVDARWERAYSFQPAPAERPAAVPPATHPAGSPSPASGVAAAGRPAGPFAAQQGGFAAATMPARYSASALAAARAILSGSPAPVARGPCGGCV